MSEAAAGSNDRKELVTSGRGRFGSVRFGLMLLATAVAAVLSVGVAPHASAIIDGSDVTNDPSFMAWISVGTAGCTGELISPVILMTAYHCVRDDAGGVRDDSGWTARIGSADPNAGGTVVGFSGPPVRVAGADIAVLQLDRQVSGTPVRLATSVPRDGTPVIATGWGATCTSGCGVAGRLQQIGGASSTGSSCVPTDLIDRPICAHFGNGGVWYGDSGGPLLLRDSDGSLSVLGVLGVASLPGGDYGGYSSVPEMLCEINVAAWQAVGYIVAPCGG